MKLFVEIFFCICLYFFCLENMYNSETSSRRYSLSKKSKDFELARLNSAEKQKCVRKFGFSLTYLYFCSQN